MRIENGASPCPEPAAPSPTDANDATSYGSIGSMIKAAAIGAIAMLF